MMSNGQIIIEIFQFLYYFLLVGVVQAVLELDFFIRFFERERKPVHYVLYISLSLFIGAFELKIQLVPLSLLFLVIRIVLLTGMGKTALKCPLSISLSVAVIVKITALLASSTNVSITSLAAPIFVPLKYGLPALGIAGSVFTFVLMIVIFQPILKKFSWRGDLPNKYSAVFFLPVLLIVLVEQYILNCVYGNETIVENTKIVKPKADHWQILLIQIFAYFCLFSILYACQKLSEDFSNRMRFVLLEQEIASQRDYAEECRFRYEQTQSFRHDIKSHLLVLNGLLDQGELQKTKEYLGKLERISESLSYPCKTGNTVVDTLLSSKLSIARQNGVKVECTVKIPSSCILDDLDLCVLFSNAVDNAIHACRQQENRNCFIRISGRQKGDFFMVEVENSCSSAGRYKKGTGLSNMDAVAEKYHGVITTEVKEGCFRLNVLLIISRHLNNISSKPY